MKVAIVHDFLTKLGGAEKVLKVLTEIYPDAPIYTLFYDQKGTKGEFSKSIIITSILQNHPLKKISQKSLLAKYPYATEQFDLSKYDVVISSSNSFAHGVITKPNTFHLSYCHSPMRYVWDWYHEYLTEHKIGFGPKGLYIRNILSTIRIWDKVASDRVDLYVANSKNVQKRIKKYYQKDSLMLYPPVDLDEINFSKNPVSDYYLIVSRLEPYKKIDLAVEAFNKNGKNLIIIGEGMQLKKLKSVAKNNIQFLGWQPDQIVYECMSKAKALIFPGEEDFGLTPVESMATGRPVIAFKKGGTLETIIEGETGLFFKEQTKEILNKAINEFEAKINYFDSNKCREQAEKFSKENFKKSFQKILDTEYQKYLERNE